jgi:signal transduction histidine kinase
MVQLEKEKVVQLERQLHVLNEVARTITYPLELSDMLNRVMDTIIGVIEPAEVGLVMLWDQSAGLFRAEGAFGYDKEVIKQFGLRAGESITGKVFDGGKAVLLGRDEVVHAMADIRPGNYSVLERSLGRNPLPICTLAVPIFSQDQRFGVLVLETIRGPELFMPEDIPFVQSLADLLALALDRMRLQAKSDIRRELKEVERLRSEAMATLSHELRMPLTAIKGYTTALLMEEIQWSEEKVNQFLHLIDTECDNMQSMIKDILDSSLIDVGQLKLELQPVRLQYIAREVVDEILRYTQIHHFISDFPANFPIVDADPRWIKQVFRNILENAVKYSPDGGLIVIRGQIRREDVVIRVADQGVGISPENLIPLFEKFYRVKSTEGFHISGTGLGLPVARSIVEAHGGRIWAESQEGEGTTMYFSLPYSIENLEESSGEDIIERNLQQKPKSEVDRNPVKG